MDAAIAEYLQALQSPDPLEPESWLARYPDLAEDLRAFLADIRFFAQQIPPKIDATPTPDDQHATRTLPDQSTTEVQTLPFVESKLPDYQILQEIARGGMGVVYRARQRSLNRLVALKMVQKSRLGSNEDSQRFFREAEAVALLDHPNIVPIYEVVEHEGQPYFSMKLIEGASLAQNRSRWAGQDRTLASMFAKIAHAVHHAHQRGILHRDLKPSNILVDERGEPHVADFGLAMRIEAGDNIARSGVVAGTPSYMAPEQALGETRKLSTAVDVYGLGAILYEMLVGQAPFRAGSTAETLLLVVHQEPNRPSSLRPEVPRDLETICLKCLEKEPAKRYPSAQAVAEDIERWLRHEPILARPTGSVERLVKWARRKPSQAILYGVIFVLFCVVAAGLIVSNVLISQALAERTQALADRTHALQTAEIAQKETEDALERESAALGERTQAFDQLRRIFRQEQRTTYLRGIMLVQRELEANRRTEARRLLKSLGPVELRAWEWYHLEKQCSPKPLRTLEGEALAFHPGSNEDVQADRIFYVPVPPRKLDTLNVANASGRTLHELPLPQPKGRPAFFNRQTLFSVSGDRKHVAFALLTDTTDRKKGGAVVYSGEVSIISLEAQQENGDGRGGWNGATLGC